MYRWASEPCRSAVTGVPRNPMPPRSLLHAEKSTAPLNEEQIGLLFAAISRAAQVDRNAVRDYALIKGSYLLGCRVSEIAAVRWKDIEALDDGGQVHLFGKGSKRRTVRISPATLELFQGLGRGDAEEFVFPSRRRDGHLTRLAIGDVCRKWGQAVGALERGRNDPTSPGRNWVRQHKWQQQSNRPFICLISLSLLVGLATATAGNHL